MPLYSYRCENCGVEFERQQSFNEEALKVCPECRKKTLKRVISPVHVVFKGSGFYATDHRSPSGAGSASSKPAKKEESKESSSTEKSKKSD